VRPLRVVGLDLGIANVGIAVTHDQIGEPRLSCRTVTPRRRNSPTAMDHERVHETIGAIQAAVRCKPDVVVIELPILVEGKGDTTVRLGEIHGCVKHWLWSQRIPYADVHLTHLKQYATGKGNASKPQVQEAAIARYGRFLHIHSYDEADATILLSMGLHAYDQALAPAPVHHSKAIVATTWPELKGDL
jgi:crossover junction endodeoxyribonuclease RuvC